MSAWLALLTRVFRPAAPSRSKGRRCECRRVFLSHREWEEQGTRFLVFSALADGTPAVIEEHYHPVAGRRCEA